MTDAVVVTQVGAVAVVVVVSVELDADVVVVAVVVVVTAVAVVGIAVVLVEELAEVTTVPFEAASTRELADDSPHHNRYAVVATTNAATTVSKVTTKYLFITQGSSLHHVMVVTMVQLIRVVLRVWEHEGQVPFDVAFDSESIL